MSDCSGDSETCDGQKNCDNRKARAEQKNCDNGKTFAERGQNIPDDSKARAEQKNCGKRKIRAGQNICAERKIFVGQKNYANRQTFAGRGQNNRAERKQIANRDDKGASAFRRFYADIYGGCWRAIENALKAEQPKLALYAGGKEPYFLDAASVLAAAALPLENAHRILDICAAPGGKTLVLASLMENDALLVANERSPERYRRLLHTLDACLAPEKRERVSAQKRDGAKLCLDKTLAPFDRILLDAPCSSERHVLADEARLSAWSPARVKSVAAQQWALLSSAWRVLSAGGFLLYATCALTQEENDGAIQKLVKKFGAANMEILNDGEILRRATLSASRLCSACSAAETPIPGAEKTECGFRILPDRQNGAGPIYFALVKKN